MGAPVVQDAPGSTGLAMGCPQGARQRNVAARPPAPPDDFAAAGLALKPTRERSSDSRAPLVVISGTGTGIGKTHFAVALLLRWGAAARVCGLKPVETGVTDGEGDDARRLRDASTFHVKPSVPWYRFGPPVSPHLAARRAGVEIRVEPIVQGVREAAASAGGVVVELAGGLFSPLAPGLLNADLARALSPHAILLVAPDRLGVLHDAAAATRAARAAGLPLTGLVLMAPEMADSSTSSNAAELPLVTDLALLGSFPRAPSADLAGSAAMDAFVAAAARAGLPLSET